MKSLRLILLGAPGSGKGTQAKYLIDNFGLTHISTGDILRAEVAQGTVLGAKAQEYMSAGNLVPDDLIIKMVEGKLAELKDSGYILDGFPRTLAQAEALDSALESLGQEINYIINLDVADEALISRLTGRRSCPDCKAVYHVESLKSKVEGVCDNCGSELVQRKDDQLEAITNRLTVYKEQTAPLLEYYSKGSKLLVLDGNNNPKEISTVLGEKLK